MSGMGWEVNGIIEDFMGYFLCIFSSENLPVPFPSLGQFEVARLELSFFSSGAWGDCSVVDCQIVATLDSLTTVPVPAAAWLFGSGLLGLVGIARRKKA